MKTYLVTGGAGFIGANFVKYILKKYEDINIIILDKLTYAGNLCTVREDLKDPRVIFVKGDICDRNLVENIFINSDIDYVVNFAAESHVDRSIENPKIFLETNIIGVQTLLDVAKTHWTIGKDENGYPVYSGGKKFLQVSTDEVYGSLEIDVPEGNEFQVKDDEIRAFLKNRKEMPKSYGTKFFTEKTPLDPKSPYSASKAGGDMLVRAYGETYHMPVNITRCSNNYGPYQFPEKLIPLMIKNTLGGEKLPVYGNGENVRDWLYVNDHCKGIDMVINNGKPGEIYNIGGYNEGRNIDIVKLIIKSLRKLAENSNKYKEALNIDIENLNESLIVFVEDRLGHDVRYAIDPSKISKELGWYPETSFEEGIEDTIRWYLDNQEWVDEVIGEDL